MEPTEYPRLLEPTEQARYNPYELTSPYDDIPPPPPTRIPKRRYSMALLGAIIVLILSVFTGIVGYSIGSSGQSHPILKSINIGATSTAAYSSGYNDGNSQSQNNTNQQLTAISNSSNATATSIASSSNSQVAQAYHNGARDRLSYIEQWIQTHCSVGSGGYFTIWFDPAGDIYCYDQFGVIQEYIPQT